MAKGSSRGADYMRGFTWGMKGEEVVMANLNKELEGIKSRSMKGLIMAAAFIRDKTEKTPPLTPVDYGNLRDSYFVVTATSTPVGAGKHAFKGPNAAQMASEHGSVLSESQGMVASQSTATKKFLIMGYSANYSGFVHEMIYANFNPEKRKGKAIRREGAGPKWLETHIKNITKKLVQIVKDNAQIKK